MRAPHGYMSAYMRRRKTQPLSGGDASAARGRAVWASHSSYAAARRSSIPFRAPCSRGGALQWERLRRWRQWRRGVRGTLCEVNAEPCLHAIPSHLCVCVCLSVEGVIGDVAALDFEPSGYARTKRTPNVMRGGDCAGHGAGAQVAHTRSRNAATSLSAL